MMRSLWISKTGLDAQQTSLDTIANNLANVSTTAYKKVRPVFEDLMWWARVCKPVPVHGWPRPSASTAWAL
jgi:flagellar basal body rod protein FlgG